MSGLSTGVQVSSVKKKRQCVDNKGQQTQSHTHTHTSSTAWSGFGRSCSSVSPPEHTGLFAHFLAMALSRFLGSSLVRRRISLISGSLRSTRSCKQARARERERERERERKRECVRVCVRVRACVCVRACVRACVCVCVCASCASLGEFGFAPTVHHTHLGAVLADAPKHLDNAGDHAHMQHGDGQVNVAVETETESMWSGTSK